MPSADSSPQSLLRFDELVDAALYGPDGFYTVGGRAGRRGDFLTSPEVGPLFGGVLARALDAWWAELGHPEPFTVVDVGAGPGTLARAVLAARPAVQSSGALDYVCVEVSATQRAAHPDGVRSLESLPDGPVTGVIVTNELLDNLPFRLMVNDGGWREAFARREGDRWVEVLDGPAPAALAPLLPANAPHGARAPFQERAGSWVRQAIDRLAPGGRLVVIDYMTARTAALALRPWREWLRTYRGHERGGHYLSDVGRQDLTCEVAIDQLVAAAGEPDAARSQAQFLRRWGIDELVEEGRELWAAQAANPGLEAMRARSRVREAEALLDPAGLGSFTVLEWIAR